MYGTDDVSISGFKDAISEQSATESATEAVTGQEQEGGVSPDTVSATSQSTDDPTKDVVRYPNFETPGKKFGSNIKCQKSTEPFIVADYTSLCE